MPVSAGEYLYDLTGGARGRHRVSSILVVDQQDAGGNRLVLVTRERRHAQHLERRRDQVGARVRGVALLLRIQERADVAVLDRAAEELAPLEHLLGIEDRAVAQREHAADGFREPDFVRA